MFLTTMTVFFLLEAADAMLPGLAMCGLLSSAVLRTCMGAHTQRDLERVTATKMAEPGTHTAHTINDGVEMFHIQQQRM